MFYLLDDLLLCTLPVAHQTAKHHAGLPHIKRTSLRKKKKKQHKKPDTKTHPTHPSTPFLSNCPFSHVLAAPLLFMQLCQHCHRCTARVRTMQSQVNVWIALRKHRTPVGRDNTATSVPQGPVPSCSPQEAERFGNFPGISLKEE